MSLAMHGPEGEICHGGLVNSYYDDPHDATGPRQSAIFSEHITNNVPLLQGQVELTTA